MLSLRMPSTLGRQWLLDDVKEAAGFDAATALQKYFDDLDNDSQRRPVIAAAQYLALFEESMARRILLLLRRAASPKTEDAPLLFGSAAEYLNAASGRGETFDVASPSDRWDAVTRFSEWFKNHYGSPP